MMTFFARGGTLAYAIEQERRVEGRVYQPVALAVFWFGAIRTINPARRFDARGT